MRASSWFNAPVLSLEFSLEVGETPRYLPFEETVPLA